MVSGRSGKRLQEGIMERAPRTGRRLVFASHGSTASAGGEPDASDPDFLPTYSFGENAVIDTGIAVQTRSITVTLENTMGNGDAGNYTLSLLDGGADRGQVTRPISGTPGFAVALT